MALIGLGVGPQLSGPADRDAAHRSRRQRSARRMGTLLLLRQVGAAVALAAPRTIYAAGLPHGSEATATGTAVSVVVLAGALVAAAALVSLPRAATRFSLAPAPAPAPVPA